MRVPVSWLREYVDLPADVSAKQLADRLTMLGLKLEALETAGGGIQGPLVVGRVLSVEPETHSNGKTIRWCSVDVGEDAPRGIVCGASNFAVSDLVVVSLPGAVLPGGFEITARRTYGHVSDGMICSARELALGDDATGIIVLPAGEAEPGTDAISLLGLREDVIEFEINPDRAYALSVRGVAREAATAYGLEFRDPARVLPAAAAGEGYPVRVDDPSGCDSFVALEVSGFDATAPTPRWLARRIQLAGMRPISLAVDVTNYVMLELGQPIHGYDTSTLDGEIVVRRASAGEKLTTLDGTARELDPGDLLITDRSGPIGLAGVMGGSSTELTESTTEVLIEAAHFDPVSIARTARRLRLQSEASKRFERGIDATIGTVAAHRVATLLVEFGGGTIAPTAAVVGEPGPLAPIAIDADLPGRVCGVPITGATASDALSTVGCAVILDGGRIEAVPPPWRGDLTDPYDLVEEVVRIVGYDKVPSVVPAAPAGRGLTSRQRLRRRIGLALASAGYVETLSYPFVGGHDLTAMQLDPADPRRTALRIANPLSDEEPLLRTTMLPGLLKALARNVGRAQPDVGLYELGSVFLPVVGERPKPPSLGVDRRPTVEELKELEATLPDQPLHLGLVLSGQRELAGWWGDGTRAGWADAVQACRVVADAVGLELDVVAGEHAPWHPGRCAQLSVGGAHAGYAGELHPAVCKAYGVPARSAAAELDLDLLIRLAAEVVPAPTFSTFPVAKEDVALVVDAEVAAADVLDALREGAGDLLESARLFDVYVGEQIGAGKKSVAYSLRFRAPDRTLTEKEVRVAVEAAVASAARRVGAVQRT
ncbi:MAG: phenylalanyl-tRNA synthetase beta chain [Nocardioidaceae bacterium]|jgi:phenylalanyl-tRNA synthetase beta chain|nr:phenylalanyl-tRNA synthetase beta chain [Nocardioidaceae bacterium]